MQNPYYESLSDWYLLNTMFNGKLNVCINLTESIYDNYETVNLLYLAYRIHNYNWSNYSFGNRLIAGAIYLVDTDEHELLDMKLEINGLEHVNNIIQLPLLDNNGNGIMINCEVTCLGDQQVMHFDSNEYQKDNYYKAENVNNQSILDIKSTEYELLNTRLTSDRMRNYNTLRVTFEGINR